jgi:pSer/pThr/pTyr-binding forkhead associated (FHA) protein
VTFAAAMRVDSLAMLAVLAIILLVLARARSPLGQAIPQAIRAVLTVVSPGSQRRFEGICPVVVGRESGSDLVLSDPEVSRRHARLEAQRGIVFLRDLESSNGTFLNGRRVKSAIELLEGDEIDVGTTRLVVESLRSL